RRHAVSNLYRPLHGRAYRQGGGRKLAEEIMGPAEIAGAVVFFITVSGTLWGIWWRIENRVEKARAEAMQRAEAALTAATQAQKEVTDMRLYAAETFAT